MSKPLTTRQAFNKLTKHPEWWRRLKDTVNKKGEQPSKKNKGRMIVARKEKLTDGFMSDLLRECGCKEIAQSTWDIPTVVKSVVVKKTTPIQAAQLKALNEMIDKKSAKQGGEYEQITK